MKNIQVGKSSGIDCLNPSLLKLSADIIAEPLCNLFNMSIHLCKIPKEFKTARIMPIHKGKSKTDLNNYRPISILPIISKILEKLVHKQLYSYLTEHDLIQSGQSGYRKYHSTTTCLCDISEYLLQNQSEGFISGGVFLDLRKAFDLIPHSLIIQKLKYYGILSKELSWFNEYLRNRSHFVSINGANSNLLTVKSGVPQGSTLGPLIFCLYINDLCNVKVSDDFKISLYADDTAVFCKSETINQLEIMLQNQCNLISNWISLNRLRLNEDKTKVMLFGPKKKVERHELNIYFSGKKIEFVKHFKYLGVILDINLNWSMHVKSLVNKVTRAIGSIHRVRQYISHKNMINLYHSLILPHIDYCCITWGLRSKLVIDRLQKFQNRFIRMLFHLSYTTSAKPYIIRLEWQTIEERIKYQFCLMVFKILNRQAPNYLNRILSIRSVSYATRHATSTRLIVPQVRLEYRKRSFFYQGPFLFNKLPFYIQSANSLYLFKKQSRQLSHIL